MRLGKWVRPPSYLFHLDGVPACFTEMRAAFRRGTRSNEQLYLCIFYQYGANAIDIAHWLQLYLIITITCYLILSCCLPNKTSVVMTYCQEYYEWTGMIAHVTWDSSVTLLQITFECKHFVMVSLVMIDTSVSGHVLAKWNTALNRFLNLELVD